MWTLSEGPDVVLLGSQSERTEGVTVCGVCGKEYVRRKVVYI